MSARRKTLGVLLLLGLFLLVLAGWLWLAPAMHPTAGSGQPAQIAEQRPLAALEEPSPQLSPASSESSAVATRTAQPGSPDFGLAYFLHVTDQTGNPLPGARVGNNSCSVPIHDASSDEKGIAVVHVIRDAEGPDDFTRTAAQGNCGLQVEAAGFAPAIVPIEPGHMDLATPQEVRLSRGAGLGVLLRSEAGLGLPGINVRLRTAARDLLREPTAPLPSPGPFSDPRFDHRFFRDMEWTRTTDATGRASFCDLPAGVPIELFVYKDRNLRWRHPSAIRIDSGENREVGLTFGEPSDVEGILVDSFDVPVPDTWVCFVAAKELAVGKYLSPFEPRIGSAFTDATGRFTVHGLATGVYFVGPVPGRDRSPNALAPRAERIDVPVERGMRPRVVHTHRGLFIRGTVSGPDGALLRGASVRARSKAGFGTIDTRSDSEGRFVLGPLFPEGFAVEASRGSLSLRKGPVAIESGAEDVLLRLE